VFKLIFGKYTNLNTLRTLFVADLINDR